jgi:protein-tyrosine phosphatase
MSFRALELPDGVPGRLWLHAMPGRLESWSAFSTQAMQHGLQGIVCLNPLHEVAGLSPEYLDAIRANTLPWRWRHLPMRDFGVAAGTSLFQTQVAAVAEELELGHVLLLHCAAGIGRTGTFAACVLKQLGCNKVEALARVRAAGSNPESSAQSGLIDSF